MYGDSWSGHQERALATFRSLSAPFLRLYGYDCALALQARRGRFGAMVNITQTKQNKPKQQQKIQTHISVTLLISDVMMDPGAQLK